MLLIKFNSNYADEFDVHGFRIVEEARWEQYKKDVVAHFEENPEAYEAYFGTNEQIIWEDADQCLREYDVTEISEEQAEVLFELFPGCKIHGYGMFVTLGGYL